MGTTESKLELPNDEQVEAEALHHLPPAWDSPDKPAILAAYSHYLTMKQLNNQLKNISSSAIKRKPRARIAAGILAAHGQVSDLRVEESLDALRKAIALNSEARAYASVHRLFTQWQGAFDDAWRTDPELRAMFIEWSDSRYRDTPSDKWPTILAHLEPRIPGVTAIEPQVVTVL